ncbi:hypothetical protein AOLI_G00161130 [Acnodon oligacanthus]
MRIRMIQGSYAGGCTMVEEDGGIYAPHLPVTCGRRSAVVMLGTPARRVREALSSAYDAIKDMARQKDLATLFAADLLFTRKKAASLVEEEEEREEADMVNLSSLTDDQLKSQLLHYGVKAGPIVGSTRALYERKLQRLMAHSSQFKVNGTSDAAKYSDSEEDEGEEEEDEDEEEESSGSEQLGPESVSLTETSATARTEQVSDILTELFPDIVTTPTGITATKRRSIKGAAGRPVQFKYLETPLSPATLERREIQQRLVPLWVQIVVFLLLAALLYLIYVSMEDPLENPFSALLDSLSDEPALTPSSQGISTKQNIHTSVEMYCHLIGRWCVGIISFSSTLLQQTIRTFTLEVNAGLQLAQWEKTTNISAHISKQERAALLANFREAIRIPTVSFSETEQNTSALREFDQLLRKVFPTVFSSSLVKHEVVADYSHLFTVLGTEPELVPYMLLAHIDVVPANEADGWEAPPFSAKELNGFIYGRGTIDNKQSVMGILQALEYLLQRGYVPRRGFYIGLGHDEEVSGFNGAVNIVKVLKSRGVKLQYVLDEGLAVLDGIINGLKGPAALIGVSEKGSATVKLSVSMKPGHSSMPPRESCIGILGAAVARLEEYPMPRLFGYGPERAIFEHLAHKFGLPLRFIMSNLWLFTPLLSRVMERRPDMNAFVRTTTAVTMFNSGVKTNVLPSHAEAFVNLRIHSAQTLQEGKDIYHEKERSKDRSLWDPLRDSRSRGSMTREGDKLLPIGQVVELIESTIADDRVKIELVSGFDPLPISSYTEQSFGFQVIKKTLLDMFPQLTVAPGICIGNTDSRHYTDLTKDIYRFAPTWFKPGDAQRFHGINERISPKNYEELVVFYFQLFQNCDIRNLPTPHASQHEL